MSRTLRRYAFCSLALTLLSLVACIPTGEKPRVAVQDGERREENAQAMRPEPKMEAPAGGAPEKGAEAPDTRGEDYERFMESPFLPTDKEKLSTFSTDVNTASYSNIRRYITQQGQLPPVNAVRIAELINYFDYDYPRPLGDDPVAFGLELAPCAWNDQHQVLRVSLAAKQYEASSLPPRNFVFLVDVSGSMNAPNKLPMVQQSLKMLVDQLTDKDHVSIVTYAGQAGLLLPPTVGTDKIKIRNAIDSLTTGGGTNGGGGISMAYEQAKQQQIAGGLNRVILMTDGDFNVGIRDPMELVKLIESRRNTGVFLTCVGFGIGNLKDSTLEQLARHGNGNYAYIDSLDEAKRVFVDQGGAMVIVAKDVKLQVEFNPKRIAAYRLIGYENRLLKNEDFRNDAKDAGDMGSGHRVTALYEIVPVGAKWTVPGTDAKQFEKALKGDGEPAGSYVTVRMRYKQPDGEEAKELSVDLAGDQAAKQPTLDLQFAESVAAWGMLLRNSPYKGSTTYDSIIKSVQASRGPDPSGLRAEFLRMVETSKTLAK